MGVGAVLMVVACDCCGEDFIFIHPRARLVCSGCSETISKRRKKRAGDIRKVIKELHEAFKPAVERVDKYFKE